MGSGAKVCTSRRSRQVLSNEYLLAKFGVDTAENGPLKVCQNFKFSQKLEKKLETKLEKKLEKT